METPRSDSDQLQVVWLPIEVNKLQFVESRADSADGEGGETFLPLPICRIEIELGARYEHS